MTTADLFASLLPLSSGAFSLSLEPGAALALRYVGVVQDGTKWSPQPPRPVDVVLPLEDLSPVDERLSLALHAWARVAREAVEELGKRAQPSWAPRDVLDGRFLKELLSAKKVVSEADFVQRWRWRLAAMLPLSPELEAAERVIVAHFEGAGTCMASADLPGGAASLEFVNVERNGGGGLSLVVRLVVWDRTEEGTQSIRDVKEQEVPFLSAGPGLEPARVVAFLTAFNECMSLKLASLEPETLMPHDLLLSPQHYKSGQTVDDFRKLLRRKLHLPEANPGG
jgi:hypothetical protein